MSGGKACQVRFSSGAARSALHATQGLALRQPAFIVRDAVSPQGGRKIVAHGASRGATGPLPPSPFRGESNHDQM